VNGKGHTSSPTKKQLNGLFLRIVGACNNSCKFVSLLEMEE